VVSGETFQAPSIASGPVGLYADAVPLTKNSASV
jgi:hypothetical protein